MNLGKFKITNKGLYWGLIITFAVLYLCVGFVSTLHSITFFHLANSLGLAVLLGLTYEIGQASVLFSILMTKNKDKFLPWALMFILTALQVTANVYASFKFMVTSGSSDWSFWQRSILFNVKAATPEMYQVIISWISGALLPIVALGMTALVANNMKLMTDEIEGVDVPLDKDLPKEEELNEIIENEVQKRMSEIPLKTLDDNYKEQVSSDTVISELIDDEFEELSQLKNEDILINSAPEINDNEFDQIFEELSQLKNEDILINPAPEINEEDLDDDLKNISVDKIKEAHEKLSEAQKITEQTDIKFPIEPAGSNPQIEVNLQLGNNIVEPWPISEGLKEELIPKIENQSEISKALNDIDSITKKNVSESQEVVTEAPKKRGRPPKKKDEDVIELKKNRNLY